MRVSGIPLSSARVKDLHFCAIAVQPIPTAEVSSGTEVELYKIARGGSASQRGRNVFRGRPLADPGGGLSGHAPPPKRVENREKITYSHL